MAGAGSMRVGGHRLALRRWRANVVAQSRGMIQFLPIFRAPSTIPWASNLRRCPGCIPAAAAACDDDT